MTACPEGCNASCYRCLRSFKNKFEHGLLDRHVGTELLNYLVTGEQPHFDADRLSNSTKLLYHDLQRQMTEGIDLEFDASVDTEYGSLTAPILAKTSTGQKFIIALSSPLTTNHLVDPALAKYCADGGSIPVIIENELIVRGNLPTATRKIRQKIGL